VYSEETVVLPDTFWCYDPLASGPAVGPLPARKNGCITLGCLNSFVKVNPGVLALWARVLRAVKNSRLVLMVPLGEARGRVARAFAEQGIARDRVEFVGRRDRDAYLASYNEIDVCLDTFPYNGHTTSLDALWMGVPVVTLVGTTVVGRAGLCQAMNLGLPQLVARSHDDYLRIVVELCEDLDRLEDLRANLRGRIEASPLMDAPRFARNLEAAYRNMWRRWTREVR
jgi:protein O-GlcNAc transferase